MTVVDANVWVSSFVSSDVHHQTSLQWLTQRSAQHAELLIPSLALAEVAGAIARRTGSSQTGHRAVSRMLSLPSLHLIPLDELLGQRAADIAASARLRGADAVYVATALARGADLATFDTEVGSRTSGLIRVFAPSV